MMMRRSAVTALALAMALAPGGCGDKGAAHSTPSGPSKMNPALEIKLIVKPAKLAMAERASFEVGFEAKNLGAAAIDPRLHDAVLTANGERVFAWDLAIQNGARDASWTQLPPGKSISMAWPLGEAMFEQPGTYKLVLALGAEQSVAEVEVTP
jgi:hypothetical protein